jgi:uncharacterized DUF497 family protein
VYTKVYIGGRVSWNETKRQQILAERGFDLVRAARIFRGNVIIEKDTRHDYGETRYIAVGTAEGEYFTVVFTPREDSETGEDILHIITAWRMGRRARGRYQDRYPP